MAEVLYYAVPAFVLLLVRAPFLVVVFGAALVTALIRLWT